jgi:UDP-N-acetylmuramoylalanine--D-glutamate ligase
MKIAIAGYGVEGEANYAYFSKDATNQITIVDQNEATGRPVPDGAVTRFGPDAFEHLQDFDLVIRTAGLAPWKIKTNGRVWSSTNEFFEKCPAAIIGVTGSKGKGTTSSLIASILKEAGCTVWLVGNIGQPPLDLMDKIQPSDIVVYELSSFQLWDIERSPHTAVVLMIEQEHLDVHKDMAEYVAAKANITKHQTADDLLIFNATNEYSQAIAAGSQAQKVGFPSEATTHIRDGFFYNGEQKLCSIEAVQLPGDHNLSNAIAAIDAVWKYTQDVTAIERGLRAFKGLLHRLSFVRTVNDVRYYDDSIATTPGSAIAALRAFDAPKVIILGGSSKGSDFSELASELTKHDVRAVVIGDEAPKIIAAMDAAGFSDYTHVKDATAAGFTQKAAELAQPGGVVILSPAAASFGLFKNYVDRGEQYTAAVNSLHIPV